MVWISPDALDQLSAHYSCSYILIFLLIVSICSLNIFVIPVDVQVNYLRTVKSAVYTGPADFYYCCYFLVVICSFLQGEWGREQVLTLTTDGGFISRMKQKMHKHNGGKKMLLFFFFNVYRLAFSATQENQETVLSQNSKSVD